MPIRLRGNWEAEKSLVEATFNQQEKDHDELKRKLEAADAKINETIAKASLERGKIIVLGSLFFIVVQVLWNVLSKKI